MKAWRAWMDKYMPGANKADANHVYGYAVVVLMHETLKKCGDDLTRDNVMKQAANLQKFERAAAAAGHHDQHQPDRLLSDPGGAAAALQGRDLGAVRRRHVGRKHLTPAIALQTGRPPDIPAAFSYGIARRDIANVYSAAAFSSFQRRDFAATFARAYMRAITGGTLKTNRRTFIGGVSTAAVLSASGVSVRAEEVRRRRDRHRDQDRPHQSLQRSGVGLRRDRQGDRGVLEERQRRAAASTAARSTSSRSTTATSPPKTVEVVRQLVEQEKVLCTFNTLGTPTNTAIHKYMNQKKVPQLFVATGASKWGKPKEFPWTMGFQPDYHTEGADLRQAHAGQRQGCQDRRADAERRLRQGLLRRLQGRPRQGRSARSSST